MLALSAKGGQRVRHGSVIYWSARAIDPDQPDICDMRDSMGSNEYLFGERAPRSGRYEELYIFGCADGHDDARRGG